MASALVGGLLASRAATPADIACIGGDDNTAQVLAGRTGITAAADLAALLASADIVVLACKPQQLAGLDPRLAGLAAGRLVISILAGKRLARLAQTFPHARNLVRAMPTTPVSSFISNLSTLSDEFRERIVTEAIFPIL